MRRHKRDPDLVDLHRPDIDGVVGILADPAKRTAFDVEQDDQHRRR
jgi:hypothetical protein